MIVFFFKQKTAYEMRISVWSSDVCSSDLLKEFGRAARTGTIPGGIIENGKLHIDKLRADTPEGAEDLVLDLYQQLPPARITDLLLEVDERTGFSEAFTHLRTGAPCSDRIGLMNVLLAEGRSEEHTSELQSLMRNSNAVFCLKNKTSKRSMMLN